MSSEGELRTALTDVLENSGVLSSLRANLRAEIFKALEDGDAAEPPKLPSVNVFINELILEYLMYNNHRRTASMLEAETGYRHSCVGRAFLEKELSIELSQEDSSIPLLYAIVESLQKRSGTFSGTQK